MKVLVFGGRKYRQRATVFAVLDALHKGERGPITKLVNGGAGGADDCSTIWATRNGFKLGKTLYVCLADWTDLSHPDAIIRESQWGKYDAKAGMRRNELMLRKYRPDLAVEFPGGTGTADMRRRLDAEKIEVIQGEAVQYTFAL